MEQTEWDKAVAAIEALIQEADEMMQSHTAAYRLMEGAKLQSYKNGLETALGIVEVCQANAKDTGEETFADTGLELPSDRVPWPSS